MVRRPQDSPRSTLRIVLTQHAVSDIEEACHYHAGIDQELRARFADDVDAAKVGS